MWPTPTPIPITIATPQFEIPLDAQGLATDVVGGWYWLESMSNGMLSTVQAVVLILIIVVGIALIVKSLKDLDNA